MRGATPVRKLRVKGLNGGFDQNWRISGGLLSDWLSSFVQFCGTAQAAPQIGSIASMTASRQKENGTCFKGALRRGIAWIFGCLCLVVSGGAPMTACASTTERVVVNRFSGLAIEGFDPVAYFVDGAAEPGSEDFEAPQDGAVWRFRNQGNRASFLAHPEIYGPQFGGYDPVDLAR